MNGSLVTSPDFARLGVPSVLTDALAPLGITTPTPIQAEAIPAALQGLVGFKNTQALTPLFADVEPLQAGLAATSPRSWPARVAMLQRSWGWLLPTMMTCSSTSAGNS